MRSQDVLHSAYMPHFRAQMNCVPGMVTEFAFIPTYTTSEYRELPFMVEKVAHINKLRAEKSVELVAKGGTALDPYTFDYLLLCNKICGASHYNMQMKVVVDTPEDYKKWLSEKTTLAQDIKAAAAADAEKKAGEEAKASTDSTAKDTVKAVIDTVKAVVAKVAMR